MFRSFDEANRVLFELVCALEFSWLCDESISAVRDIGYCEDFCFTLVCRLDSAVVDRLPKRISELFR